MTPPVMSSPAPSGADQRKVGDTAWSYLVAFHDLGLDQRKPSLARAYHAPWPWTLPSDAFIRGRALPVDTTATRIPAGDPLCGPSEFRPRQIGRWLPPSLIIPPSYTCSVGITARLLTVHIGHKLRQPILWRGALTSRGTRCLDRGHDLSLSPAVLPAADRMS